MVHVSIVSHFIIFSLVCWLIPVFLVSRRSKIQICRKKNFHNVGFFDPDIIHEKSLALNPGDIVNVIYRGLRKNSMCPFILLPYNHHFHWILLCIRIEEHKVLVYDSLRQDKSKYQDLIEVVNTAWSRYLRKHIGLPIGEIEPLRWVTDFSVWIYSRY